MNLQKYCLSNFHKAFWLCLICECEFLSSCIHPLPPVLFPQHFLGITIRIINHRMNLFFFFPSFHPYLLIFLTSVLLRACETILHHVLYVLSLSSSASLLMLCSLCCFSSCLIRSRPSGTLRYETWHLLLRAPPLTDKAHKPTVCMHTCIYVQHIHHEYQEVQLTGSLQRDMQDRRFPVSPRPPPSLLVRVYIQPCERFIIQLLNLISEWEMIVHVLHSD